MEQKRSLESNDFSSWNSENFIKLKDIELKGLPEAAANGSAEF
jgi:hypothetical protein